MNHIDRLIVSIQITVGVTLAIIPIYGSWWAILYGTFWPVWLSYRLALWLLKGA